jgi:hypothetical protein
MPAGFENALYTIIKLTPKLLIFFSLPFNGLLKQKVFPRIPFSELNSEF